MVEKGWNDEPSIRKEDRCADREGELLVVQAGPKFEILARNPMGEGMYATPAIHRGVMYLRTYGHLISVGGK